MGRSGTQAPSYYTSDWGAACRSVEMLARLRPEVAATGRGAPRRGEGMRRELETLASDWKEDSVPSWGRYVDRPAVTDVHGVIRVPPPVVDPQLLAPVGLGGVALGLWWLPTPRSRSR